MSQIQAQIQRVRQIANGMLREGKPTSCKFWWRVNPLPNDVKVLALPEPTDMPPGGTVTATAAMRPSQMKPNEWALSIGTLMHVEWAGDDKAGTNLFKQCRELGSYIETGRVNTEYLDTDSTEPMYWQDLIGLTASDVFVWPMCLARAIRLQGEYPRDSKELAAFGEQDHGSCMKGVRIADKKLQVIPSEYYFGFKFDDVAMSTLKALDSIELQITTNDSQTVNTDIKPLPDPPHEDWLLLPEVLARFKDMPKDTIISSDRSKTNPVRIRKFNKNRLYWWPDLDRRFAVDKYPRTNT